MAALDDGGIDAGDRLVDPVLIGVALGGDEAGVKITIVALDRLHGEERVVEKASDIGAQVGWGNAARLVEGHPKILQVVQGVAREAAVEQGPPLADCVCGFAPDDLVKPVLVHGACRRRLILGDHKRSHNECSAETGDDRPLAEGEVHSWNASQRAASIGLVSNRNADVVPHPRQYPDRTMFETLSDRFDGIFSRIRGRGKLTEADVDDVLREIRLALLEADVNLDVTKNLVGRIRERSVGEELSKALNPAQQVIKIVLEELTASLGGEAMKIAYASKPPTVVLMAGLQGAGKTTNTGKLAQWFKKQGRNPLLVGADLQRPAAVEQLRTLAGQVGVPVFSEPSDPVTVASKAIDEANRTGRDVVIVDTAGRLAIDEELMEQVRQISGQVQPDYTFLVIDAMTGQDAVNTAKAFNETLELDGVILTKLDGDARGGAALSVKEVVGKPIAFASTGEKLDEFETFHPDRLASRILGMGDVETLIEKAEEAFEQEQAEEAAARLMDGTFTLEDFLEQMQQIKKMGPIGNLMGMMPGIPKEARDVEIDDGHIARLEGIIRSMTPAERRDPDIIDGSRRQRIAAGSGMQPSDVKNLLDQFGQMRKMMKQFAGFGTKKQNPKNRRGKNNKKGKKGGRRKQGGRVTEKGPAKVSKAPLTLPGLEDGELPPGFPSLPNS